MPEIGQTISHFKIVEKIGEGGMGTVFLADDTTLDRKVALKFLPDAFTSDPERMARFEREAKLLASLNHPNIAGIHGLERADGSRFLVLEYVEGETLQARLSKGALPLEDALSLCRQIAEGLEAAHEKGVIHRDLKPANVMITADEKVKILDFGLAKAFSDETQGLDSSQSPTLTETMTQPGVILGTAAYMSPEQAMGKNIDKRADIWAFGCILYECLTGRKAFEGETVTETLAAILKSVPDWQLLPDTIPPSTRMLLRRCLEKDRNRRYRDIADVLIQIEESSDYVQVTGIVAKTRPVRQRLVPLGVIAVIAIVAIVFAIWSFNASKPSMPAHVKISLQPADQIGSTDAYNNSRPTRTAIAFSPDGSYLAFIGERGDPPVSQLYLRALDTEDAVPVAGTEGAVGPFFSPDGQWIGFWSEGELKKVSIVGGPSSSLCKESIAPFGASWGANNTIYFGRMDGGLMQVPASGGEPNPVTALDRTQREWSHRLPQILPDGKAILFTITRRQFPTWDESDIAAQSLETGKRKLLIRGGADGRYLQSGHLVFARKGVLMAAPFDTGRLERTGDALAIIDDVMQSVNTVGPAGETGATQYAISSTGSLAYLSGGIVPDEKSSLVFVDRRGSIKPVAEQPGRQFVPRFSPDGRKLAFFIFSRGEHSVWIYDLDREALVRMTKSYGAFPLWTPDGSRLAFEDHNLFWQPVDLSTPPEQLAESEFRQFPLSWTPDGKTLVFVQTEASGSHDIWELTLDGDRQPRPLVQTQANEWDATISPDGNYLAYSSDELGREEVYVKPYPGPGGVKRVSVAGGSEPAWSRSGKELFYISGSDDSNTVSMCALEIAFKPSFKAGKPRVLFEGQIPDNMISRRYDVTSDGQLFVMCLTERIPAPKISEIHAILNWFEELKQKVPVP
jgi:serine/threonine protein kinase